MQNPLPDDSSSPEQVAFDLNRTLVEPREEIYLGVDPGLVNLGISLYNKTREIFDVCQVCLPVWKGRLHKIDRRHFYTVFREKCKTVLAHLFAKPLTRIGIEYQYEFFKSQCPELNFFAQVLFHVLKEKCEDVQWICPKKWRKATNTGDEKYCDRKGNSWKSPIFENLPFMHRHFTVKGEKLEDGMEAALIAYVTCHNIDYVRINPTLPSQETPAPAPVMLLNKPPRHPEMIRYITRNTGKVSIKTPSRTRTRRTKVVKAAEPKEVANVNLAESEDEDVIIL